MHFIHLMEPRMTKDMIDSINMSLTSERFLNGESVSKFEEEFASYIGTKSAISVNNGTNALLISLLALDVKQGDFIITTPATFIATVNSIKLAGAEPLLVDIKMDDYNIDPEQIKACLETYGNSVSGIIPVHLYGRPAPMNKVLSIAEQNNIFVIEDACQAHGAEFSGKRAGSLGSSGAFSFYPSKNMTVAGDGGMITTNDSEIAEKSRILRDSGRSTGKKYEHEVIGFTARLNTINAAFGREQLKGLPDQVKKRKHNASMYFDLLSSCDEIILPQKDDKIYSSGWHQFVIRNPKRDGLARYLLDAGIETGIHYPIPVHLQPVYKKIGIKTFGTLKNSERWAKEILSIPVHGNLEDNDIHYIAEKILEYFR